MINLLPLEHLSMTSKDFQYLYQMHAASNWPLLKQLICPVFFVKISHLLKTSNSSKVSKSIPASPASTFTWCDFPMKLKPFVRISINWSNGLLWFCSSKMNFRCKLVDFWFLLLPGRTEFIVCFLDVVQRLVGVKSLNLKPMSGFQIWIESNRCF